MKLNAIFAKDVQRPIEGVIKADDTAHLGTEVDEYVLTNEAAKGLELLLEAYTNYTNANGVWISGFFGSGKSHLLKMLAHLLGDVDGQEFPRERVSESFRSKAQGAFLPALLTKADRIPAKSLLFNIDQKATLITKDQGDALLKVFVKVFDESCGYYGNQGHVARFERDLDNRGQYEAFKAAYAQVAGRDWAHGREEGVLEEANVAKAYAEVSGQTEGTPTNILTKYRNEYSVSIEDFANEVKAWVDKQDEGFRLNFFVDEVGQFIGSNTHLMLNLQTIAESLNTKCQGRAWVFVTSQEDMDKVVGDRTKQQGNDFSKIQARFRTRVKLTSADVEEVIRKRLLEKNEAGKSALAKIYAEQHANFKTLFDFVDGAKTYRNYTDEAHFTGTYPFVSYQFPLFQAAIEGISDHNVFEGRNSSVGERSMLGVVQQVAKDVGDVEVGRLATFDHMFAGIRASLKSAAQRSIDVAERNLDNELAVRLLKALFLVKYVEGFHATPRNLTVLVYDQFGLDLHALSKQVQEALTLLETQTYVQRNGNVYVYLTNEEQVIEEEIKNVDIDASEASSRLFKMLTSDVIRTNKLRYTKNGQDFAFGYKLDDQVYGQQRELTVHFITPEYPFSSEETRMHSAGKDELRVILEPDERAMSDLRLLIKTEKYIKRKQKTSLSAIEDQILRSKATQNVEREKEIVERIRRAVGKADLVINAADVTSAAQDAIARVTDGFQDLVSRTYTQLSLLSGSTYSEQQIGMFANPDQSGMFDDPSLSKLAIPGDEVLSFVLQRDRLGEQVTVRTIVNAFQAKPYGWDLASIEVVIAWLVGTSKLTITVDGNALKRTEVATVLRNTQKHSHAVVAPQKVFDERKVATFRKFCSDFFDEATAPKDPLELARHGSDKLRAKLDELKAQMSGSKYPFVEQLTAPIALLEQAVGKPDEWYLTEFDLGDELLDAKESVTDPIQSFLSGSQRVIYDEAVTLLTANTNNLGYLPAGSDADVKRRLGDPNAFRGNRMTQLKQAAEVLSKQIGEALATNRAMVIQAIEGRKAEVLGSAYYEHATENAQQRVVREIDQIIARVEGETQIALLREVGNSFEETTYPELLDLLASSTRPTSDDGPALEPVKQTVSVKTITVPGVYGLLETTEDVDRYLYALRSALLSTLNDGKRIAL
ncbi:ATP-binding protein [Streptomyces sp. NRRL F-4711]|uniref:BREX system P-loop protein BrxC n=1 Tax=unclassified Streptomyces TaxID=2593676 RepID=UPI0004BF6EFA|nr:MULTISPECIES: BREX system P-loop protein BrxC [unclassified Streptomyces]KOT97329.1 ATP-binding protein [Streptomyces sp. NRRL F-4711]